MNINYQVIPHQQQRYPTVGDWWFDKEGNMSIRVSRMSDWRYECCIGVHEIVEALICKHLGITQESVDRFDIEFEKKRAKGNFDEPGDDKDSPYRIPHGIASAVERLLGACLGIDWNKYADEVEGL
jgi:hypothetical protein